MEIKYRYPVTEKIPLYDKPTNWTTFLVIQNIEK
jgi:hypothetical protein